MSTYSIVCIYEETERASTLKMKREEIKKRNYI